LAEAHRFGPEGSEQGHMHRAEPPQSDGGNQEFRSLGQQGGHAIATADAGGRQAAGEAGREVGQLAIGELFLVAGGILVA
jgi:hypothetical protein